MHRSGFETDYNYDWVIKKNGGNVDSKQDGPKQGATQDLINQAVKDVRQVEERKETRVGMGQQVLAGTNPNGFKQQSMEERKNPYGQTAK